MPNKPILVRREVGREADTGDFDRKMDRIVAGILQPLKVIVLLTISFANSKGGVGKSTACLCIAGAYAKAGSRVHIIDLDSNGTISRWLSKEETRPPGITVSKADPQELGVELQKVARTFAPDLCLIDLAGAYEVALSIALFRSHLTLLPVCPSSEADIFEAVRVAAHLKTLFAAKGQGRKPFYRVLLTKTTTLLTLAHFHGIDQLRQLNLPMLASRLTERTAYKEVGFSGCPPHFAPIRDTTAKAIRELDGLKGELDHLLKHDEAPPRPALQLEQTA
jgi:chromosome partitioning protein